jgi:hypothetical protein
LIPRVDPLKMLFSVHHIPRCNAMSVSQPLSL